MVIIRETGVLARSRDPNSVAVSNWAERTDYRLRVVGRLLVGMIDGECAGTDETDLEHRQEQVLFPTFVLVSVEREHDCLQEDVDLGHGDQSTEGGDMSRFGLEQKEQVSVGLSTPRESAKSALSSSQSKYL